MSNFNIIDYKMNSIGIKTAMFFPQFGQIYIPDRLKNAAIIMHEKLHEEFFNNTYGLIINDFFVILQTLKDHIIHNMDNIITSILNFKADEKEINKEDIERLKTGKFDENLKNNLSVLALVSIIDEELSYDDNFVDICAFCNKMNKKYNILINNARFTHEGIATYLTLVSDKISRIEKDKIYAILSKNDFYYNAYEMVCDLKKKWGVYFKNILDIIFKVPLYNYDLIGMTLKEFEDICKFIYNPDKRLEFMLNCTDNQRKYISDIINNKNEIICEHNRRSGVQDIRHKFAYELLQESYMLEIHNIMGIEVPDYKRPFEYMYDFNDVSSSFYMSIEYILVEHSRMHKQVEDIFRRIGAKGRPINYIYNSNISRNYFLYGRAKENRMLVDKIYSISLPEENEIELDDFITLDNINELIDLNLFCARTKTIFKKGEMRIMDNQIIIYGNSKELKLLEDAFIIRNIFLLQTSDSINNAGFHNPEALSEISNIIIAIGSLGGATGVLVGISKIIKARKLDISIDLKKKTIDIKNVTCEEIIEIFDQVLDEIK